jgi:hypothetical protein
MISWSMNGRWTLLALDQLDRDAEVAEDGRVFAADHPSADDDQALGQALEGEDLVAVEHLLAIEGDGGRPQRPAAAGDQQMVAGEPERLCRAPAESRPYGHRGSGPCH